MRSSAKRGGGEKGKIKVFWGGLVKPDADPVDLPCHLVSIYMFNIWYELVSLYTQFEFKGFRVSGLLV